MMNLEFRNRKNCHIFLSCFFTLGFRIGIFRGKPLLFLNKQQLWIRIRDQDAENKQTIILKRKSRPTRRGFKPLTALTSANGHRKHSQPRCGHKMFSRKARAIRLFPNRAIITFVTRSLAI